MCRAVSDVGRYLQQDLLKHRMRHQRAHYRADDLNADIGECFVKFDFPAQQECQRHGGIEMRSRHGTEHRDQNEQDRAGRDRVSQKRESHVSARKTFGHDA